ncbi:MAG: N-acetyl-gamma-glutamyl-phosphate reductase [Candidatus Omnitrophica bacterium]|nr:N-acetyl-gamma-glutamyl-phosphate reductase [Candidatus Omnitrophota bacterium]
MLRCAVVGAKGYTGLEIIKLLLKHPDVTISFLADMDKEPVPVQQFLPHISPKVNLKIAQYDFDLVGEKSDVVFLALPHRVSLLYAEQFLKKNAVVIDLSADYRFKKVSIYEKWYDKKHSSKHLLKQAVYGLSELNKEAIAKAQLIANPGCFPTGTILGLAPLLMNGLVKTEGIVIDSKTGASGAGRNPSPTNHFGELHENFKAYKVNVHQHTPEIKDQLDRLSKDDVGITFVPHLLPLSRGILTTLYLERKSGVSENDVRTAFNDIYKNNIFIRIKDKGTFPQLKDVAHTNFCDIGLTCDKQTDRLIVITAIDNLLKGAAGQAVQNMNIRCGFAEECGFFE